MNNLSLMGPMRINPELQQVATFYLRLLCEYLLLLQWRELKTLRSSVRPRLWALWALMRISEKLPRVVIHNLFKQYSDKGS